MNRKMIAMVVLVVVGVLAVSAFSWTTDHDPNHEGMAIYHQSERASYAGISASGFNQQGMDVYHQSEWNSAQIQATEQQIRDVESNRWMGAALVSQVQATEQQKRDVEGARWLGAALALQRQEMSLVHYGPPGR